MPDKTILQTILAHKRAELDSISTHIPKRLRPVRDFRAALAAPGARFILECKRASPSAGELRSDLPVNDIVTAYRGTADAVSVLTDTRFFNGSLDDLAQAAASIDVPVLRKDFILDAFQLREAHAYGADAVLLMLSVLDDNSWRSCAREAARLGLGVLTEVHDDAELERALALDAGIIGINNRSFHDLSVDLAVTRQLAPRVPADRVLICESGIRDRDDVLSLAAYVDAFLVGSSLMRAPRIDLAARELVHHEVKICGITRVDDARAAWDAGARWGGLVFAEHSPRRVSVERARAIADASPLPMVGVFMNEDVGVVANLARSLSLAAVQLHGNENDAYAAALRPLLPVGCGIWKAVRVRDVSPDVATFADRLIFDGPRPGSGQRFDWSVLPPCSRHHGLAGGIHAGNVGEAMATGAGLFDISSGVETIPGVKCREKLQELFAAIRAATGKRGNRNVLA